MGKYVLSCCSTTDLTPEFFTRRDVSYISFHYELDGKSYRDDFGQTIPLKDFYQAMAQGALTRTSQVNVQEYEEYFRAFLKAGQDVLHVTLSTGISGTYNAAVVAAEHVGAEFPDRVIYVVDSLGASSGYGLLMDKLADMRDAGLTIAEAKAWVEEWRLHLQHWFISTDLTFFVRGGRISKTAGFIGNVLNICPLMRVDAKGRLEVVSKVRTRKKAYRELVRCMQAYGNAGYAEKCFISQSACYEEARAVAELIEQAFPDIREGVQIFDIGTTIGSHTGGGTIALFFWGEKREDELRSV